MERNEILAILTGYFVLLALVLFSFQIGQAAWYIILMSAIAWFAIEARYSRSGLGNALKIGAFLLAFDFIFENSGWISGLWQTYSQFHVGVVPIQVMGIAFFGGAAWAMYQPRKFDFVHSLLDCAVFGFFGALGEWLLIRQGLFAYHMWWTSELAFASYFLTWVLLHFVRYRIFKG
ncbi:MAG: hypothetical protein KGH72_05780 [Candidatus Micrarchaeota archaeon]|nr:hypothetical protein [Candidatus Micrarchaeota archaeon]